jgi:NADH-quinone oxidoreductase subunit E
MWTDDPAAAHFRPARRRPFCGGSSVTSALTAEIRAEIERQRDRYPQARSAVIPALWAVQNAVGYLSPAGMAEVAMLLRLEPSEVEAVATFYSMYFDKPAGHHHVLVCANVSCALRGADDIVAHLERSLGCPSGETSDDSEFTWERTVECLGACGGAPAMQVDHHSEENLTPERVDAILDALRGAPAEYGAAPAEKTARGAAADAPRATPAATRPASKPSPSRARPRPRSGDL